jgi:hypothetical protein
VILFTGFVEKVVEKKIQVSTGSSNVASNHPDDASEIWKTRRVRTKREACEMAADDVQVNTKVPRFKVKLESSAFFRNI